MVEKKLAEVEEKIGGIELKLAQAESLTWPKLMKSPTLRRLLMLPRKGGKTKASQMLRLCGAYCSPSPDSWVWQRMVGSPANNGSNRGFPSKKSRANPLPGSRSPCSKPSQRCWWKRDPQHEGAAINTHMEMVDLEVTSNLHAEEG